LYFEYGELWKSLKIIRKLIDDDKKNEELAITKFQIERKLKKYKSAEHTLKKIYKRLPGDYKYLGLLAEHYKSIGKLKKGEKAYKELLRNDSVNEIGIIGLTTFYIESDRIAEAENLIRKKLINKSELNEIEIQFLINSLKTESLNESLRKNFVTIIKDWFANNPENEIDLKNMSEVFVSAGYTKDLSELLEYLYNNSTSFSNLDLYLMVLNLQDRNDDILKITGDSIESGQISNYLFYYNGIGYYKNKKFQQAAESFKRGLNFMEEDHSYEEQMLTLLAESCYKLNDIEAAFSYFEKVLDINPYNLYVLNNYSYYLAVLETSLDKAEEMSKKCILMDKHNFNYLDTYGWVLFKKGKYKEALDILKKALDSGGKSDENVINHYQEILKVMNIKG
jgi:tetratricopeptide (TPR) repeat protein